jgi:hypothetical protein
VAHCGSLWQSFLIEDTGNHLSVRVSPGYMTWSIIHTPSSAVCKTH